MIAASRSGFGTPCSAAMKMIMKKPAFFQTSMITIEVVALSLEVSQWTGAKPRRIEVVIDHAEIVAVHSPPNDATKAAAMMTSRKGEADR